MKELNKHILNEALKKLPTQEPRVGLWNNIDLELTALEHESDLQISLSRLPQHEPSDAVWEQIDQSLEGTQEKRPNKNRTISMTRWAAAAAVLLLFGSFWYWNTTFTSQDSVTVSYSEEMVPAGFLEVNWETDEDAFAMVAEFCKTENMVCQQPGFKIMTEELEELNTAREQLKLAMENYGNDPALIAQLTEIEHVRTDLLKQLVKRI